MGIGAFRYNTRNVEPYSSRGPTNDGRRGVSVAAPTCSTASAYSGPFCGTSGAAPHAGGVAALVASTSDLGASEIQSVIEDTADSMSETVNARGDGALNASAAVGEVMEDTEPVEPVTLDYPDTAITGGEVELTVNTGEFSTAAVEANSDDFGVELSVTDDGGDSPNPVSDARVEFIDIDEETSTYVLNVNVTGGNEGDTGEISAYVGGNADEDDSDASVSSTFTLIDATSSPVEDVSDELWTAVTQNDNDNGLSLADLGNAIQEYQANPGDADVGGVDIGLSQLGALIQHYQAVVA
ncbi:MAG: S8 family serine peptidase [Halobacteriales archaeon]|nr:S8 family serine peptidase [Halobacteriales archaeon]